MAQRNPNKRRSLDVSTKIQKALSTLTEVTTGTSSDVEERDRRRFRARLDTFEISTWFAKPKELVAQNCARKGWKNVGLDMLQCEACGVRLDATIDSALDPDTAELLTKDLVAQLQSRHADTCVWKEQEVPGYFCAGPIGPFAQQGLVLRVRCLINRLKHRAPNESNSHSPYPTLSCEPTESNQLINSVEGILQSRSVPSTMSKENRASVYALAVCGWEPSETDASGEENTMYLQCTCCNMKIKLDVERYTGIMWPPSLDEKNNDKSEQANLAANSEDTSEGFEPPTLVRKLTPKEKAVASIGSGPRFGQAVFKRSRSSGSVQNANKRFCSGSIPGVGARGSESDFDLLSGHRGNCAYYRGGFQNLLDIYDSRRGACAVSSENNSEATNVLEQARAALKKIRAL
eukprot:m.128932 g.128932  ORF g.128932 m.128932 type:complete len:404 (+) comp14568_c0_seq5:185-1396(+)